MTAELSVQKVLCIQPPGMGIARVEPKSCQKSRMDGRSRHDVLSRNLMFASYAEASHFQG